MLNFRMSDLHKRIVLIAGFMTLFMNLAFFRALNRVYPWADFPVFFVAVGLFFTALHVLLIALLAHGRFARWWVALVALATPASAYFMDSYGTVIDSTMLDNMVQTNVAEAGDLMSPAMALYALAALVMVGFALRALPSSTPWKPHLKSLGVTFLASLLVIVGSVAPVSSQFASFLREHKAVRYYANPGYPITSVVKFLGNSFEQATAGPLIDIDPGAKIDEPPSHKELVIVVVGETARADHFSLNGYGRQTNPELAKRGVVSFSNVSSCGTSTAVSVPCMFSGLGMDEFTVKDGLKHTNLLDMLSSAGVQVLWRDNNSDSKGVALRVDYEDFKTPDKNPVCDEECRDEGMLVGLEKYIDRYKDNDVLIVLHQMGNHGPAYYKRYPKAFEKFTPVCMTNELSKCSTQEIVNAYDNAILYTDHFLGKVIDLLKRYDTTREAAMLYVSDHGESLGEYGVYLHGAPRAFAPKAQIHVPAVVWTGPLFEYQRSDLMKYKDEALSHDQLFCAVAVAFEVSSPLCTRTYQSTAAGR